MNTEVVMKRKFFDGEISQKSKTGFYSLNDLFRVGNRWRLLNGMNQIRMIDWINSNPVKEFIKELTSQFGEVKKATRGRNANTWVHPYLLIDAALYINPKFKVEVYSWLFDELLKYRNDSGDSYKKMAGALFANSSNKSTFHRGIQKTANIIKTACKADDWETATEEQLKLRDRIHENIALLCDVLRDNNQAIRLGIEKALNN